MFEIWQCFKYRDGIFSRLATVKIKYDSKFYFKVEQQEP
jgi:hypothetical protein